MSKYDTRVAGNLRAETCEIAEGCAAAAEMAACGGGGGGGGEELRLETKVAGSPRRCCCVGLEYHEHTWFCPVQESVGKGYFKAQTLDISPS